MRKKVYNPFAYLDSINDLELIKQLEEQSMDKTIMPIFWKAYKAALTNDLPEIERARNRLRCRWIANMFAASIPVTKNIKKFRTPHGLRGMAISRYAKIEKGCTIFQNVTIGSNTIIGSKGAGFPSIGENVFIGAGAAIIGNVKIGKNVRIGANCIVTEDVPDNSIVVLERPKIIQRNYELDNSFVPAKEFKKWFDEQQKNK